MKRRRFLTATASAGLASAAGAYSWLNHPRSARAAWGDWPSDRLDLAIPEADRARSVLELHVNGGMSCFDTFYTVPSWGQDNYRFAHLFAPGSPYNPAGLANRDQRFEQCASATALSQGLWVPFGAEDTAGNEIYLGPWIYPFRSRPDVLSRMRIVVQRHDQAAHEGANPISFTGDRLGTPRMAGVGAAIQRHFMEVEERVAPYSYVLYPAGYSPFNAVAATTIGFHPGSARPLALSVDINSQLFQLLSRDRIDDPEAFENALMHYRARYEAQLQYGGADLRSPERDNFRFADDSRHNAQALESILSPDLFSPMTFPSLCGDSLSGPDMVSMQARMAARLLTRPTDAARYVMWIDAGARPSETGGHDTHRESIEQNGLNLPHTFAALLDNIRDPANPRSGDDQRINLDETMVVINTEFGRTPTVQGNYGGTNHHPYGYVNIFIGGPVQQGNGGRTVYGHMEGSGGVAQQWVSPAENRMMVLQAMGIYPFSSQTFNVSDVQGAEDEPEAALRVRDEYLGYQG